MFELYERFAKDLGFQAVGLILYTTGQYEKKPDEASIPILEILVFEKATQAVHFARRAR